MNSKASVAKNLFKGKIGLFGGTFDPPHNGHLNLACELLEKNQLKEVWFIPAALSPFPKNDYPASCEDRLAMVKCAISDFANFKAIDVELHRKPPSYTIDTVNFLINKYPKEEFVLILGEDAALNFYLWKESEAIIQKLPLLIGSRKEIFLREKIDQLPTSDSMKKALKAALEETAMMDISATELRKRLASGKYCGHLIPQKVLNYINEKSGLYKENKLNYSR